MSSIRKTKKAMKKSDGFFTAVMDNGMCFCVSEWYILKYHKKGISVGNAEYLPYNLIKGLIIGGRRVMDDFAFEEDILLIQDLGECPDGNV